MCGRKAILGTGLLWIIGSLPQEVRSGPEVCGGSGPIVCVRFENLPTTPIAGTDYSFDFTDPSQPIVQLERGSDTQTQRSWRVWSKDAQGEPADIGSISALTAYNYSVLLAQPDGDPGALNVGSILLTPSGDHYSILQIGTSVAGDVGGDITIQSSSSASAWADLIVDGEVSGNVANGYAILNL